MNNITQDKNIILNNDGTENRWCKERGINKSNIVSMFDEREREIEIDRERKGVNQEDLSKINLEGMNLQGVYLGYTVLWDANLSECDLRGANLEYSELSGMNALNSNFEGANFDINNSGLTHFTNTNLKGVTLIDLITHRSHRVLYFQNARYDSFTKLPDSHFTATMKKEDGIYCADDEFKLHAWSHQKGIDKVNLKVKISELIKQNIGIKLSNASLILADLSNINLRGTDLTMSYLYKTNFTESDLRGTKFGKDDLRSNSKIRIDLNKSFYKNAQYNKNTEFPDYFNPAEAGMIKIED